MNFYFTKHVWKYFLYILNKRIAHLLTDTEFRRLKLYTVRNSENLFRKFALKSVTKCENTYKRDMYVVVHTDKFTCTCSVCRVVNVPSFLSILFSRPLSAKDL